MKVTIYYDVTEEQRLAFAWRIDGKEWDGKRKASRSEISSLLMDGSDETFDVLMADFELKREATHAK